MGPREGVKRALSLPKDATVEEIARACEGLLPAAYEILRDGQGVVVYPDWP